MERRCPNCDQVLLADESVCWHCGESLPEEPGEQDSSDSYQDAAGRSPVPLEIYAVWTVVLIVAALAVTAVLGRQPRLQAANVPLPEGWVATTDRGRTFTVFLPESWEKLDVSDEDARSRLPQLLNDNVAYQQATEPLTGFVEDEELLFLARGSAPTEQAAPGAFLIVVRSRLLNRLAPAEAIGLAQQGDIAVSDARQVTAYERRHVALRATLPVPDAEEMICRQQFITGEQDALLLSLCATPKRLSQNAIDTILGSVQRLAP